MYEIPNWAAVLVAAVLLGLGYAGGLGRGKQAKERELAALYFPHWIREIRLDRLVDAKANLRTEMAALQHHEAKVKEWLKD